LSPGELWHLWRATEGEGLAGLALRLMVLTGCRVKEATHLPSAEVDVTAKAWNLAAARNKSGRDRMIPLSRQAVEVLKRAGELGDSAHVFGPVTSLSVTVKRVRAAMGGEHWEPRDLRRTAATLCARLGADPFVVALVLGHAQADPRMPAVTRTYLRWNYTERVRGILDKLGEWVEETVTASEAPGAVAEFRR
jgi:integrase